jgi:ankyrin repeat protein
MRASERGHVAIVVELLKHDDLDLDVRNVDGWSALTFASFEGHVSVVNELLKEEKLDVNLQDPFALVFATKHNLVKVVERQS